MPQDGQRRTAHAQGPYRKAASLGASRVCQCEGRHVHRVLRRPMRRRRRHKLTTANCRKSAKTPAPRSHAHSPARESGAGPAHRTRTKRRFLGPWHQSRWRGHQRPRQKNRLDRLLPAASSPEDQQPPDGHAQCGPTGGGGTHRWLVQALSQTAGHWLSRACLQHCEPLRSGLHEKTAWRIASRLKNLSGCRIGGTDHRHGVVRFDHAASTEAKRDSNV